MKENRLDMFAASAMIGLMIVPNMTSQEIAERAYDVAEAMLKESRKRYEKWCIKQKNLDKPDKD